MPIPSKTTLPLNFQRGERHINLDFLFSCAECPQLFLAYDNCFRLAASSSQPTPSTPLDDDDEVPDLISDDNEEMPALIREGGRGTLTRAKL
ncbi:hypothetical protein B0H13DRAFT_2345102 [Mycena leptocephala]|nr:hypothetical protein B0H13DRAFT_2353628 [Mycena leptocephala]KAJ7881657.1 hypothetical protein B0H13DRAFT_2345102 [Mycena leptocephala]